MRRRNYNFKINPQVLNSLIESKKMEIHFGERNLPETVYHYTPTENKRSILKHGLVPTNWYSKDHIPVVWFHPKRNLLYGGGCLEIRVQTDKNDPCWLLNHGGIWGSIVYANRIDPERLTIESVYQIKKNNPDWWKKEEDSN